MLLPALIVGLSGCAQSGRSFGQRTTVGSLKTGLSQLEFQNQQLRREVANLNADNRRIEDQLVQEEAENGELSARLDDARNLVTRRSVEGGEMTTDLDPPRRAIPAGQSTRKRRKPPFAKIPGRIAPIPSVEDEGGGDSQSRRDTDDDPVREGRRDRTSSWLPVIVGAMEPKNQAKR